MTFDIDIKHWPTVEAFAAYLAIIPRPPWCSGLCNHNTYIPNERQWQGEISMRSMMKTYVGKGWTAGPHLYLAAEAPRSEHRGIWQMTPLAHRGVHAGPCNRDRLGLENVGDFDARAPSWAQWQLCVAVNVALCRAWGLPATAINVHKECMSDRTCPGRYFDANRLRSDVGAQLAPIRRFRVRGIPIYQASSLSGTIAKHLKGDEEITIDRVYANGAGHVAGPNGGPGFIALDLNALEEI